MNVRQLDAGEIELIRDGLLALAQHHNGIPSPFAGAYPPVPVEETLADIASQLREGKARVEAVFEKSELAGFCKASATPTLGVIDYLFVREDRRGMGYGGRLLENALAWLRERGVDLIDVRVVAGNPAQKLYEKFGFQTRALVMSRRPELRGFKESR